MGRKKYVEALVAAVAVLLWAALALLGGPPNRLEQAAMEALAAQSFAHPLLTHAEIWITFLGSAVVTLALAGLSAAYLIWRGRIAHAAALIAIVSGGRLMVELLKLWLARPRPDLGLHAVIVESPSFPSGHATNSMITFVAIALFCAPYERRRAAVILAVAVSLLVGLTRPLLGVHWPSDVLAGWIFGLLWAVGWWRILGASSLGVGTGGSPSPLSGARRPKMAPTPRDPAEQALIEDAENEPTPSHSGGSGGGVARDVGSRDELVHGTGKDGGVTRVHKGDKPNGGDMPNLPNR